MLRNRIIEFFMLIPLLKKVLTDSDAVEVRRVENILIENKIPYRIKTYQTRGSIGMAMDSRSYAASNLAMYKGSGTPSVSYGIYVRRKDYERVKNLIS
jgi:hypothetical protein